jgi:hypothetical protein
MSNRFIGRPTFLDDGAATCFDGGRRIPSRYEPGQNRMDRLRLAAAGLALAASPLLGREKRASC